MATSTTLLLPSSRLTHRAPTEPVLVPSSPPFCTFEPSASSHTVPLRVMKVNGMVTVAGVGSGLPGGVHRRVGELHRHRAVDRVDRQLGRVVVRNDLPGRHCDIVVVQRAVGAGSVTIWKVSPVPSVPSSGSVPRQRRHLDSVRAFGIGLRRSGFVVAVRQLLDAEVLAGHVRRAHRHRAACCRACRPAHRWRSRPWSPSCPAARRAGAALPTVPVVRRQLQHVVGVR